MDSGPVTSPPYSEHQLRRIVLVRHGRPNIDKNIDRTQWGLSEASVQAVKSLGKRLKDRGFEFESIISSPETKAFQTAQAISSSLGGASVKVDVDLSEHRMNNSDFLAQEDFEAGIVRLFTDDPSTLVFGEETADATIDRFRAVIQRQSESSAGDLIAVTHGTILSLYAGRTLGMDSLQLWRSLKMPMAIVICGDQLETIEAVEE